MENSVSNAEGFLGDLPQYNQLRRSFMEYVDELKAYRLEQYETWCSDVIRLIDDSKNPIRYTVNCL